MVILQIGNEISISGLKTYFLSSKVNLKFFHATLFNFICKLKFSARTTGTGTILKSSKLSPLQRPVVLYFFGVAQPMGLISVDSVFKNGAIVGARIFAGSKPTFDEV